MDPFHEDVLFENAQEFSMAGIGAPTPAAGHALASPIKAGLLLPDR